MLKAIIKNEKTKPKSRYTIILETISEDFSNDLSFSNSKLVLLYASALSKRGAIKPAVFSIVNLLMVNSRDASTPTIEFIIFVAYFV